jgi:N-acetylneuraminic acid mutarotase
LPAEIYNPVTNSWVDAATPALDRPANPTANLLKDGRVLVIGGQQMWNSPDENTERAEIYDPRANTWSFATPEVRVGARQDQTATVLANGQILYAGGSRDIKPTGSVTLYDPATNAWTQVANMTENRFGHGAELLPSGNVIVMGGGCGCIYEPSTATAEQYAPAQNLWYPVASMDSPRGFVVTVNLHNGIVFVFGGLQSSGTSADVSVYYSTS